MILGLYLLFAPIGLLARKPSPIRRELRRPIDPKSVPLWMKIAFRGLGLLLVVGGWLLAAPAFVGP